MHIVAPLVLGERVVRRVVCVRTTYRFSLNMATDRCHTDPFSAAQQSEAVQVLERVLIAAGPVLLGNFSTLDARSLRLVSKLFTEIVGGQPWADTRTAVPSRMASAALLSACTGRADMWT